MKKLIHFFIFFILFNNSSYSKDLLSLGLEVNSFSQLKEKRTIFFKDSQMIAEGKIIHCSINPITRTKVSMPDNLEKWIEASNISDTVKEY